MSAVVAISSSCDARSSRQSSAALLLIDPQPGKYITRQPDDSVSIEGSISSGMSSTFGSGESAPPHGALLESRSGAAGSGVKMGQNFEF